MDHHEAAAADIAGAGISDGHGEADGDSGIDGVAAAVENLNTNARGAGFLCHHHAVLSNDAARRRNDGPSRLKLLRVRCNTEQQRGEDGKSAGSEREQDHRISLSEAKTG
jgi:hypothetical protein